MNGFQVLAVGLAVGTGFGVQLGRWSLLLFRPRRRRSVRLPPQVPRPHAGSYVEPGSEAGWGTLEVPGSFRRVR